MLLPGTTFGLGKCDFANGRAFVEENVPVALGSDINPGTCWCESMPMVIAIAARYEKLTVAEAIVAATLNAAYATGVGGHVGSIQPGKLADILIADVSDYRQLAYRYGANPIWTVTKRARSGLALTLEGILVRGRTSPISSLYCLTDPFRLPLFPNDLPLLFPSP